MDCSPSGSPAHGISQAEILEWVAISSSRRSSRPRDWTSLSLHSEKAMAPHSSTFAWKIPWTEEPGRLQSMGSLESDSTERFHFHFSLSWIGEGNGNPLQCSCLENPRDREAWWAAVYGVPQSQTWLKRLSSSSSSSLHCRHILFGWATRDAQLALLKCW